MAQFDPAAATAAYLAQLPPEVHAKATAYTQGGHWIDLWTAVVAVLVAWLVLRSGVLVKLRGGIERKKARPWLAAFVVLLVDGLLEAVLGLPWTVYADWGRETAYGFTSQPLAGWLAEWAVMAVISVLATVILLTLIYALVRRAPRTWWIWSGGLTALFVVVIMGSAPLIMSLFNDFTPAPPGPVRDAVVELARANGVPSDKIFIYDGSKQSSRYTANVTGVGGTAQISMSDVMFQKGADMAEVRAVVAHEMGHYVHKHLLWFAGVYGLLALVGSFLIDRLFTPVLRLTGGRGVQGLSDPAGFPVVSMLITVIALLATPVTNSLIRITEADADAFSLKAANEPDGLASALIKTVEYRAATPSRLEEVIFYSHPAVSRRVERAMDWKAAHPPTAAGK